MQLSGAHALVAARSGSASTLAFLYVPLIVVAIYAFNARSCRCGRRRALRCDWFSKALAQHRRARRARGRRVKAGLGATRDRARARHAGGDAVARYRFFGRETVSFLVILPIALPGIVTGMALNATFTQVLHSDLDAADDDRRRTRRSASSSSTTTSIARLRRTSRSFEEASADLGAHSLADVPLRDVPADALGARGRRAAGVRASLRRGHRHDVHRGRARRRCRSGSSATCRGREPADRQRRRARGDRAVDLPVWFAQRLTADRDGDSAAAGATTAVAVARSPGGVGVCAIGEWRLA